MNWEESSSDFDSSGEHASDRRTVLTERVSSGLVEKASAALMGREGVWDLGFTAGSAGERGISLVLIA